MLAIIIALISTLVLILVALVATEVRGKTWSAVIGNFTVTAIVESSLLYFVMPPRTGPLWGLAWLLLIAVIINLIFSGIVAYEHDDYTSPAAVMVPGCIGLVIIMIAGAMTLGYPWSDGSAKELAAILKIDTEEYKAYPETDPEHMVLITESMAETKVQQAFVKAGSFNGRSIESTYVIGDTVIQKINDQLVWVTSLRFSAGKSRWRAEGEIPGYFVVDAENPNAEAQFKSGFRMKYVPDGWMGEELERLVHEKYPNYVIDDLSLEIDDNWKPFYSASLNRPVDASQPTGNRPTASVVVNPQNGEIQIYNLNETPKWVDRVFSSETVKTLVNYWGQWGEAPRRVIGTEEKSNRYKVSDDVDPELVYDKNGVASWQVIVTSLNSDTGAKYVGLIDARTGRTRMFEPEDTVTIESEAIKVASSSGDLKRNGYKASSDAQLYKLYGKLAWVIPVLPSGKTTFAGVVILPASSPEATSVAFGENVADALAQYRQYLATSGTKDGTGDATRDSFTKTVEGTVSISEAYVNNGNTIVLLKLQNHTETFAIKVDVKSEAALFTGEGDKVRLTYIDTGIESERVDIQSITLLGATASVSGG